MKIRPSNEGGSNLFTPFMTLQMDLQISTEAVLLLLLYNLSYLLKLPWYQVLLVRLKLCFSSSSTKKGNLQEHGHRAGQKHSNSLSTEDMEKILNGYDKRVRAGVEGNMSLVLIELTLF